MKKPTTRFGLPMAMKVAVVAVTALGLGPVASGCITRPIAPNEPTTKTNFTAVVRQAAIDKVDLLFAIDNSASMGDKQELLKEAVPDLISRLLSPDCVDETDPTKVLGPSKVQDGEAVCSAGKLEFPPVHDMHIGIISSSLGGRGGDQCGNEATRHNDDRAHLLNRATKTETVVGQATPSNFLAWLPQNDKNKSKSRDKNQVGATPFTDQAAMVQNFQDLIIGVKENGCGYEAQLESMYRFLMQPDPYDKLVKEGEVVKYDGYDFELLKQRRDFLRPDSLVAVIMVTDENESTVAPTAFGGRGWFFSDGKRVRPGTQACDTDPASDACKSCYLSAASGDPGCAKQLDETNDHPNVRFFHMKQRFGIDPRFPIERYVRGLKERRVPNRDNEYAADLRYIGNDADKATCLNPLFSANLPSEPGQELCALTAGPRTSDLVYFAIIGGVPWQLLTEDQTNLSSNYQGRKFKDRLGAADWTLLLGNDPFKYDFAGQHPLMQESITPRPSAGADEAHTREWNTANKDLQYACTFTLPSPKDCSQPDLRDFCDCSDPTDSPLCQAAGSKTQTKGKAYPTISELAVAKALGDQSIVASICPPEPKDKSTPYYGYRPAVRAIVDRLKNSLASQCLPDKLSQDQDGKVSCLILESFQEPGVTCESKGLKKPDPKILEKFREAERAERGAEADKNVVCEAPQILPAKFSGNSCEKTPEVGWCYLTGAAAGGTCPQAIKFSELGNPVGARVSLQCIKSNESDAGAK